MDKYMKKFSASLTIRELQIKMTLRFSLTPERMDTTKNQIITNAGKGVGGKGSLLQYCWWECKQAQPLDLAIPL